MRLGVFGGAFDPPHNGHLALAQAAVEQLGLERLLIVPNGLPPHRAASRTSAATRLQLCQAAFAGLPAAEVSALELAGAGPQHTVETLARLAGPEVELWLLLGGDEWAAFPGWHEPERIRTLAKIAVAPRDGLPLAPGADFLLLAPLGPAVSSTLLRQLLAAGEPVEGLLPPAVAKRIGELELYRLAEVS